MKERITYIIRDPKNNEFNPETLQIDENSLSFTKGVDAAKEWSVTVGLDELGERIDPKTTQWLYEILRNSHELHIRWSTPERYDAIAPFASRVAPGVHAFWTPLADGGDDKEIGYVLSLTLLISFFHSILTCVTRTKVCGLIHRLFGPLLPTTDKNEIKCERVEVCNLTAGQRRMTLLTIRYRNHSRQCRYCQVVSRMPPHASSSLMFPI